MTVRDFVSHGNAEPFKGSVHGLACGLSALMFAYNAVAWLIRRERHLATNVVVYGAAMVYESRQTWRHLNSNGSGR